MLGANCLPGDALLIALDQDAAYDDANSAWLATRLGRFFCIDRVVVAEYAQRRGRAGALYGGLQTHPDDPGDERLVYGIRLDPPNTGPVAFHQTRGVGKRVGDYARPF